MQVGRTRGATDVVESELSHVGVELEEEGQRLSNAAGGTEDGDLGELESASIQLSVSHAIVSQSGLRLY